ncbi:hypothetical protein [Arthrobacter sp. ISL-95]|uniref:hypothetical protein n=1 Tax=Arthrobacter sp. ISL-95 TaxID=2819116 RepID=UPI001BE712A5|nr:hypothetical protein [Arthrobacter sp. ISL-95]MBT2586462.1 hypothetical protein [Arthrobacter sp. ISL-95]
MPAVEEIAQTSTGLRHLILMSALTELKPVDSNRQVGVELLYKEPERWGFDKQVISNDLEALQERGWIWFERSLVGIQTVVIVQAGVDAAEDFSQLKGNRRRRAQEIRDAVLNWLYDLYLQGVEASGISDFLTSPSNQYLGDQYSEEELGRAATWLLTEDYIEGIETFGGELARPAITTKGIRVIETEQSVNKALTSAGMTVNEINISDSQGVNVAVASSNVRQSNTLTQGQIDQIEKVLGSVRAMLNPMVIGASEEVTMEAQTIVREVEDEIHSEAPSTGKVKALLLKLTELAATGTVQGGVDALNAMMQQGISGLN